MAEKIAEQYLVPLIGVWDNYAQIDFQSLPERFVMKTNHGSGDAVIVRHKSKMGLADKLRLRRTIQTALQIDFGAELCELHYSFIPHRILAEELIGSDDEDLRDYKFLCFNGKAYYCWVDFNRYSKHTRNVYDTAWNLQPWNINTFANYPDDVPKPKNYEKMVELAETLAKGYSHVRVDFYNVDGKIYFGEMTFTTASGLHKLPAKETDQMLGALWTVDTSKRESRYLASEKSA